MLQLTQNLKSGKMEINEVPVPAIESGKILVRNHYSVISAGTEGSKVSVARKGYIGKAKAKPDKVKQVIDTVKKEGVVATYNKVMKKLDSLSPLGYSTAGVVIRVGNNVHGFKTGDRVACAGADIANHAEIISVPENLAVKVNDAIFLEDAAYTTLASIAMQGVRQADLRLGESCVIIGLGLLGQLTSQFLRASGIKAVGIDINKDMVLLAKKSGIDLAISRDNGELEEVIHNISNGYGVDAVIITAATSSNDPVELAGRICRQKGKVIIVGDCPTGFSRETYYKKELELKMSMSYGPGRYDPEYELKGRDYPIGYVRWTENRNMQAFIDLLASKKIDISLLTTHAFDFENALQAYQMIIENSQHYAGILLKYDVEKDIKKTIFFEKNYKIQNRMPKDKSLIPKVSFIGAGSFAQSFILPFVKNNRLLSVATSQGHTSKNIARKWNFDTATCDADEIIKDDSNTLFITTRHNMHAQYVMKALRAGKNIFVEKPLCLNEDELKIIVDIYKEKSNDKDIKLMVGFNRRFAPLTQKLKKIFVSDQPKAINYRINSGNIKAGSWIQDKDVGGGRIIGEVCHFVDLAMFIANSLPKSVFANAIMDSQNLLDTLNISLTFRNGSIANISYFSNGSNELEKERLEVFSNGVTAVIDDFKKLYIYDKKRKKESLLNRDKGHKNEVELFLKSVKKGQVSPIPFEQIYWATKVTFDIIKSITNRIIIEY